MPVSLATYASLGTASYSVDATTAKNLSSAVATGTSLATLKSNLKDLVGKKALISCPGGDIRFSVGGATPTSSTYHKLVAGSVLTLDVDLEGFSFISAVGTVTVYVDYYGG